ncbi:hypothetical protein CMV_016377 [Castanea mollissima]|uniref:DUF4408 domain-containing protein n=1 Tax=Castanea mollissima TaxID=60419 RepID=A0A8J4QU14_9ROSI|nr:hypothetical protein CMV_016377 [Castanea mollissima]
MASMLSLKLVLISTGVLTMAMALKVSVPVVSDFVVSEVPSIWSVVLTWLRPPYLYIVINCIIISIVASSKLHTRTDKDPAPEMVPLTPVPVVKVSDDVRISDYSDMFENGVVLSGGGLGYSVGYDATEKKVMDGGEDDAAVVVSRPVERKDSMELSFLNNENEKPPVSARFAHRKAVKASPEGVRSLGVSKPKRQETLENTWKTITEGRSMPLTRHLKKSDTWESHVRRNPTPNDENDSTTTPPTQKMKKSETFSDNRNNANNSSLSPSPGSGRLRREPSLSQDELNRRVEAFINKFNEEMRLQRQESLNQYQEMIRRGGVAQ